MDNQNTKLMDVWFVEIPVLILVLMDNQNTKLMMVVKVVKMVLILVLMDNQNTAERAIDAAQVES